MRATHVSDKCGDVAVVVDQCGCCHLDPVLNKVSFLLTVWIPYPQRREVDIAMCAYQMFERPEGFECCAEYFLAQVAQVSDLIVLRRVLSCSSCSGIRI